MNLIISFAFLQKGKRMDNTSWYRISYDVTLKDETTVKIYRTVFETSNYSLSEESVDWCRQAMGIKKDAERKENG